MKEDLVMTLEEKIFERKRFIPEKLLEYGFNYKAGAYLYEADFMNGNFRAVIEVSESRAITGKVIDMMNEEEYIQLRIENLSNAYVVQVRSEYEKILSDIADACCVAVLFASNQANRITKKYRRSMIFARIFHGSRVNIKAMELFVMRNRKSGLL